MKRRHVTRRILDEVQRVPVLFRAIKRSVDQRREPGTH
jgi:predicted AAA+ superfamily ATPase